MKNKNALKAILVFNAITAFATTAAHADWVGNEGLACGSASSVASGHSQSSSCDWYQWANSGPVVTTVQSMSNGFFGQGFFTANGWFNVQSGGTSIGHGNGGPQGEENASPYHPSTGYHPNGSPAAVPEPGTFVLMGLGLAGLAYGLRRRKVLA